MYRSLAGSLLWLLSAIMPQASCTASFMQQLVTRMRFRDLIDANSKVKELRDLRERIRYIIIETKFNYTVYSYSDASFNISSSQSYVQTGIVTCLAFDTNRGSTRIYRIDCNSSKQRKVSHSSYGVEILAYADAEDRCFYGKLALKSIFTSMKICHKLNVYSKGLYDTITTLHESKEYRLRQTVQRIRDSFKSEELDILRWIQGFANIADALTKHNPKSNRLIAHVFFTGMLDLLKH